MKGVSDMKIIAKKFGMPAHSEFHEYVKRGTTRIAGPYPPPVKVGSADGTHYITDHECYIGIDSDGFPYSITENDMRAYERVTGLVSEDDPNLDNLDAA